MYKSKYMNLGRWGDTIQSVLVQDSKDCLFPKYNRVYRFMPLPHHTTEKSQTGPSSRQERPYSCSSPSSILSKLKFSNFISSG